MLQQGEGIAPPDVVPKMAASFDEEFAAKFPETRLVPRGWFHLGAVTRLGRYAYGELNILSFGGAQEWLEIGEWVSIGPEVLFVVGGEHRLDRLSTFPHEVFVAGENYNPRLNISKGPIIVRDDVWIGAKAMILSGVEIGQGAVIGAGSVVARDVEPYEVVAGSPVVHVRYRFPLELRKKLMAVAFAKLTPEKVAKLRPLLEVPLTDQMLDEILKEANR